MSLFVLCVFEMGSDKFHKLKVRRIVAMHFGEKQHKKHHHRSLVTNELV